MSLSARHAFLLTSALSCATSCASAPGGAPEPSDVPSPVATATRAADAPRAPRAPVPLEAYFAVRRVPPAASISFDEKWVAFATDLGGRIDLWVTPVEGGAPKQLTHVEGFLGNFAFSPTQDRLVYLADRGGNELMRLYLTNAAGEAPTEVTAGDPATATAEFLTWTEDGRSFLYKSTRRDERFADLYAYDLKSGTSERLYQADGKLDVTLSSRDGRRFVLTETLSDVNTNLWLLERGKGAPVLLTPHTGDVTYWPTSFSKDGQTLHYASDASGEFASLYAMDLARKTSKPLLQAEWDVEDGQVSEGGRYFVTHVNADGTPRITITDTRTQQTLALPGATPERALVPLTFSRRDRIVVASVVTDAEPRNLVIIDLEKQSSHSPVDVLSDALRGRTMVTGRSVRIPSFDGRQVPAFLYAPPGDGPFPALIDVHGGPTAQSRRTFDLWRQYAVSKGYVVLVPNVRGSTGYGKTYMALDNLDLGGGPLEDVVAAKQWLVREAKVDAARVVVMGGSYGGYMALCAATFKPTEFVANVDYFGVSDLKSVVESFPAAWATYSTFIYKKFGDPKDPAHARYQHDRSPIHFLDRVARPLLVVQGANDARVKQDQSDRVVAALRARQVPVHYLLLAGEGHGFSKNESRLAAFQATDRFLDRYVFGDTSVVVIPGEK